MNKSNKMKNNLIKIESSKSQCVYVAIYMQKKKIVYLLVKISPYKSIELNWFQFINISCIAKSCLLKLFRASFHLKHIHSFNCLAVRQYRQLYVLDVADYILLWVKFSAYETSTV